MILAVVGVPHIVKQNWNKLDFGEEKRTLQANSRVLKGHVNSVYKCLSFVEPTICVCLCVGNCVSAICVRLCLVDCM